MPVKEYWRGQKSVAADNTSTQDDWLCFLHCSKQLAPLPQALGSIMSLKGTELATLLRAFGDHFKKLKEKEKERESSSAICSGHQHTK